MKNFPVSMLLMVCLMLTAVSAQSEDLILDYPLTINVPTIYDNVVIQAGGILTADAEITVNNTMIVEAGGIVTHSERLLEGLRLNVANSLIINIGGIIDVTGKGLLGGIGGAGDETRLGESIDPVTEEVVRGTPESSGGSHGGHGGNALSPTYGDECGPTLPGAGGGGGELPGENGGAGGGVVIITASSLELDGEVKADGEDGPGTSGGSGGAGGTIQIDVNDLSGSGGFSAQGGKAPEGPKAGGGGGGRIKILSNTDEFNGSFNSAGGPNNDGGTGHAGSAGTQYHQNTAEPFGRLILDNNNITDANNTEVCLSGALGPRTFKEVNIVNHGALVVKQDIQPFVVTDQLLSGSAGRLSFEGSHVLDQGSLVVEGGDVYADAIIHVEGSGNVAGSGAITAILENNGHVGSGSSSGELKINGDYLQSSMGSLEIGIRGTTPVSDYNRLVINGQASLDGTLEVSFLDGFVPSGPDTFKVLNYAGHTGEFSSYLGFDPSLLIPTYDDTSLVLAYVTVSCCEIRGDIDHNNQLDALDIVYFVEWLWKSGPPPPCMDEADVNSNDQEDALDLTYLVEYIWKSGPAPVPCP